MERTISYRIVGADGTGSRPSTTSPLLRARLIRTLLEFRQRSGARVTRLSGDVDVGSAGQVVSSRPEDCRSAGARSAVVMQITSWVIVNVPPWTAEMFAREAVAAAGRQQISRGVVTEVQEVDSGMEHLRLRTSVAMARDAPGTDGGKGRLSSEWIAEDGRPRKPAVVSP